MGYLEKNFILHRRGEDKKLLPIDYFIKELNANVSIIPITRGGYSSFTSKLTHAADEKERVLLWDTLISKHFLIPKLSIEDIKSMKMIWVKSEDGMISVDSKNLFVDAIFKVSGIEFQIEKKLKKK